MENCLKRHVAVGVIVNDDNKILIACRPDHTDYGGFWEFPGGKIEKNETSYQALCRELDEELGINVLQAELRLKIDHDYPEYSVQLDVWSVENFSGKAIGREGQQIKWVGVADLNDYTFLEASREILAELF